MRVDQLLQLLRHGKSTNIRNESEKWIFIFAYLWIWLSVYNAFLSDSLCDVFCLLLTPHWDGYSSHIVANIDYNRCDVYVKCAIFYISLRLNSFCFFFLSFVSSRSCVQYGRYVWAGVCEYFDLQSFVFMCISMTCVFGASHFTYIKHTNLPKWSKSTMLDI